MLLKSPHVLLKGVCVVVRGTLASRWGTLFTGVGRWPDLIGRARVLNFNLGPSGLLVGLDQVD